VHLEGSKIVVRFNPVTGRDEKAEIPARYGCAKCGGEFLVDEALAWKTVKDIKKCPHCHSPKVLIAIEMEKGVVLACKHCNRLGLYERPGFEGKVTVEDVKAAGKLTEEALEFFGGRGFQFDVKRAKARRVAPGPS
jgi:DNA-directed RNA polymerase subunit RPC12/RpoP